MHRGRRSIGLSLSELLLAVLILVVLSSLLVPALSESAGDVLPDSLEPSLGGTEETPLNGGHFSPDEIDTDDDGRMGSQYYVMNTQDAWEIGVADDQDWANPGHQY